MEKLRMDMYCLPSNAEEANNFLVSEFGEGARNTFGVPRTLNGVEYSTCSWYMDLEDAERISAYIPEIIMVSNDKFEKFGYINQGE